MPRFVPNAARKTSSSVSNQRPNKPIETRLHFKKELALRIKRAAGLESKDLTKSKSKNREKVSREMKKYQTSVKI
jgi:hypothetical protein